MSDSFVLNFQWSTAFFVSEAFGLHTRVSSWDSSVGDLPVV